MQEVLPSEARDPTVDPLQSAVEANAVAFGYGPERFNRAYLSCFRQVHLTVGIMSPMSETAEGMADFLAERSLATLADELGFAAIWARDVPLLAPQGGSFSSASLDDPFLWLSQMASATRTIALGTAGIVLPLHHPLHVAKSALTLNRMTGGRFLLGLGSGDRQAEFAAFGLDPALRGEQYQRHWSIVRAALSPVLAERELLLALTGGYDLMAVPKTRVPMLTIGSARQSLQWIAQHADGWATYHRDEARQQGRMDLWRMALRDRASGASKPFIQSLYLDLVDSKSAPPEPLELGFRTGRNALLSYLLRIQDKQVNHVLLNLAKGPRPIREVMDEIGREILPNLVIT